MKTPLIIDNYGDLLIFDTLESAETYLEPIDILNHEYVGYDAEGCLLSFSVYENQLSIDKVIVSLAEQEPTHQAELKEKLNKFLKYLQEVELETLTLEELVKIGVSKYQTK